MHVLSRCVGTTDYLDSPSLVWDLIGAGTQWLGGSDVRLRSSNVLLLPFDRGSAMGFRGNKP